MRIEYLYWKDHIVEKIIERHGVTPDEVEEVIHEGEPEIRKSGKIRYLMWGQSCAGRYLFIVLEEESQGVFVPLTAREMTESEKRAFKKRQGSNY
jgi:uncharacterized DUF497 family protein